MIRNLFLLVLVLVITAFPVHGFGGKPSTQSNTLRNPTSGTSPYPEMVLIPTSSFVMGEQDKTFIAELNTSKYEFYGIPNRLIHIEQPFYIGKYEVTFEQYDYYVRHPSNLEKNLKLPSSAKGGRSNYPVVNISWQEAMDYASWLGKQTERECRLPTEAEWEYAARAGTHTAYSWGNNVGANNANCKDCGSLWDNKQSAPVGSFSANAFGLHDMAGNVWEWTCSEWQDELNGQEQQCSMKATFFIPAIRGGSWKDHADMVRSASRGTNHPLDYSDYHGFRVMCSMAANK